MAIKFPVTGSLVEIRYGSGETIGFAQGMKIEKRIEYTPVRVLGLAYPRTFVISFVTITGGFVVADTGDMTVLLWVFKEIVESCKSSNPDNWGSFDLVGTSKPLATIEGLPQDAGIADAPSYVVRQCRIIDISTSVDTSGKLLSTQVSFVGRYVEVPQGMTF